MIIDEEAYLEHYGVKGMKWGIRKDRTPGVARKTDRDARKDAKEFARAKMFYGEGAGNRRKLINKSVEAKRKKDSSYGKAFDRHLERETSNLDRHASKAKKERTRTDRRLRTKQRAGALARTFTGEMGTQAAFVAVGLAGAAYLKSPKGQATLSRAMATAKVKFSSMPKADDWLKANGIRT